ncbi:MAG: M18 family aminopeptidase [Gammaproteobacteria bacterium]
MSQKAFNAALAAFIDASPTPFHAVANMRDRLVAAGFEELDEAQPWQLAARGAYFVTRNDSSIVAFRLGAAAPATDGLRMVGAHTDSPCLKLKPNPVVEAHGYVKLGVEVYGGVLLNPWFDRDLSIAGRVTLKGRGGRLRSSLVDLAAPVAIIPSLAIHLDREANANRSINQQTMLPPVVALAGKEPFDLVRLLEKHLRGEGRLERGEAILDFELSLYPVEGVATLGFGDEFIAGARLDNLLSCFTGLDALLAARPGHGQLLVCNDHEEVGSGSTAGARGNFLASVLERITRSDEDYARVIANSMLVSTDNAHGIHPNFSDRHDARHGPLLNAGPVIKLNSNQAYATNSESAAMLRHAAAQAKVDLQAFVVRTDMGCGSTIGPLTATALGVRTVDVGVPTFGMHSIRELAGADDAYALWRVLKKFYALPSLAIGAAS